MTNKIDTLNLRAMMDIPEIDLDPMEKMMQDAADKVAKKEMQIIEDILRHHIDNPIVGELTREKIKAAGVRGVAYDRDAVKSELTHEGQNVVFTLTSGLLGVVQGDWLIGAEGVRRPLTDNERMFYDEQDRREQMTGRIVMVNDGNCEQLAYLHGIDRDDYGDYYQLTTVDGNALEQPDDADLQLRLATDAEVVADYLAKCQEAVKGNFD